MMYPVLSNNWLDNEFNDMFSDDWFPTVSHRSLTAPAINVKETDKDYELELAAPGSTKEDFQVNLDKDGNLVIKMEHKNEKKDENKKEHYLRATISRLLRCLTMWRKTRSPLRWSTVYSM